MESLALNRAAKEQISTQSLHIAIQSRLLSNIQSVIHRSHATTQARQAIIRFEFSKIVIFYCYE